ncbi:MAG: exported protein of unknown function [Candidatus Saccharibacteria bacterium]|nr:exported protein of unknown function [Candidatus Saccharibacteria bacterium]
MKQFLRGLCGLLLLSGVALIAPAPPVSAAEGFNVITSPLPIKIATNPGKTVEAELRIKSQNTKPEGIKVGLMKFKGNGTTGQPDLLDITSKDTFASWVTFSPSQFVAQPGVWNTIKMTIKVPEDASLGYYLAVTFSPSKEPGAPDVTNLKGSAATLVLLDVKTGNEQRKLQLEDFSADHKLFEYVPANFNVKVRNKGNIYIPPVGNIFIMRGDKTVDTLDFNAAGGSVLPDSARVFKMPWDRGFPVFKDRLVDGKPVTDSNGKLKQDLKWNFAEANKFRFGKYTAKLLIAYDDGQRDVPIESTLTFWVIPWKLLLVLLLIVSLVGFGVFILARGAVRKARQGAGKYRRDKS